MFRIYCSFQPEFKRANGSRHAQAVKKRPKQFRQGRGAWVVEYVQHVSLTHSPVVVRKISYPPSKVLMMCCPTPRRIGTRCSPRKLLAEYQAARRG